MPVFPTIRFEYRIRGFYYVEMIGGFIPKTILF